MHNNVQTITLFLPVSEKDNDYSNTIFTGLLLFLRNYWESMPSVKFNAPLSSSEVDWASDGGKKRNGMNDTLPSDQHWK